MNIKLNKTQKKYPSAYKLVKKLDKILQKPSLTYTERDLISRLIDDVSKSQDFKVAKFYLNNI